MEYGQLGLTDCKLKSLQDSMVAGQTDKQSWLCATVPDGVAPMMQAHAEDDRWLVSCPCGSS